MQNQNHISKCADRKTLIEVEQKIPSSVGVTPQKTRAFSAVSFRFPRVSAYFAQRFHLPASSAAAAFVARMELRLACARPR